MEIQKENNTFLITGTENDLLNLLLHAETGTQHLIKELKNDINNDTEKLLTETIKNKQQQLTQYKRLLYNLQIKRGIDPNTL